VALLKPVQDRLETHWHRAATEPDLLYFSSPSVVKAMALGYDSLAADIYWMRAIQYYGRRDEAARRQVRYKNLPALLDIVTTLDANMVDVYRAGSIFLSEPDPIGAGLPHEALRLLDKGISGRPKDWRLRFDKGMVYYWHLQDFRQAGEVWLEASRLPAAPEWMQPLAAATLSHGGEVETAKSLWRLQLQDSTRSDLKENARNHLASIQVDEDLWTLEFLLEKFVAAHGALPPSLESLVTAGFLKFVPADPSGVPYYYNPATGRITLSVDSKAPYFALTQGYRKSFRDRLAQWYESIRR
jgi:hypothetical protein